MKAVPAVLFLIFLFGFLLLPLNVQAASGPGTAPGYTIKLMNYNKLVNPGDILFFQVTGLNGTTAYIVIMDSTHTNVYALLRTEPFNGTVYQTVQWVVKNTPAGNYVALLRNYVGSPVVSASFSVNNYDTTGISLSNMGNQLMVAKQSLDDLASQQSSLIETVLAVVVAAVGVRFSTPLLKQQLQHKDEADKRRYYRLIGKYIHREFRRVDPRYEEKVLSGVPKAPEGSSLTRLRDTVPLRLRYRSKGRAKPEAEQPTASGPGSEPVSEASSKAVLDDESAEPAPPETSPMPKPKEPDILDEPLPYEKEEVSEPRSEPEKEVYTGSPAWQTARSMSGELAEPGVDLSNIHTFADALRVAEGDYEKAALYLKLVRGDQ